MCTTETCRTPGLLVRANLSWCPLRRLFFLFGNILPILYNFIDRDFFFRHINIPICRRFDQPETFFFYYPNDHLTTGWPQLIVYVVRTYYVQIKITRKMQVSRNEMDYLTVTCIRRIGSQPERTYKNPNRFRK